MNDESLWGDAKVISADWHGTAQLHQRKTSGRIEEVVGLDPDEWWVIGLEIRDSESSDYLKVVAVRRNQIPEGSDPLPRLADENEGELPVTEFLVHGVDPFQVLREATHVFKLRMRNRGARDLPIRVLKESDSYPER